ncbi:conserved hypothetical protein [uncultured Defluviicoccus sp.]|uniref:MlaB-like STAS domain-containing protein n=1 Tax=metagenome TaxID=256318 RepID=A0A380T952_9ZZZZ|nr:conserved hypothetical protein [uncultured Defluviicoccus sp.]
MSLLVLPAVMDLRAAQPLKADIQAHAGAPLDLDASKVERMGGLCLQVLLAAETAWRATGHAFRVINPAETFRNDARLMGAAHLLPGLETC